MIGDTKKYAVYRLIDVNEVDHSGNREFAGKYVEDKKIALFVAQELNKKESPHEAD